MSASEFGMTRFSWGATQGGMGNAKVRSVWETACCVPPRTPCVTRAPRPCVVPAAKPLPKAMRARIIQLTSETDMRFLDPSLAPYDPNWRPY